MKRHLPLLLFGMSALCVAQVQNIPDTNFPTVRSFINSNFSYLAGAVAGKQATLTNYSTISGLTGYPSTFPPVNSGDWLGTWYSHSVSYFQTAISGAPSTWPSFSTVATSGSYSDLSSKPTLGTAAAHASEDFEPAAGNPGVNGYVWSSTTGGTRSWVPQSGGGGGGSIPIVSFNPNSATSLTCPGTAGASFQASTTLTGPSTSIATISCAPSGGNAVQVQFYVILGATPYDLTLPAPFGGACPFSKGPASGTMVLSGTYDGTNYYDTTCSPSASGSYFPGAVEVAGPTLFDSPVTVAGAPSGSYVKADGTGFGTPSGGGTSAYNVLSYNFPQYSCSGTGTITCVPGGSSTSNLSPGTVTLTLTPVPLGVNGSLYIPASPHALYLFINDSVGGNSEAVPIVSGGTAVGGASTGTVKVTLAKSHGSGNYLIQPATKGAQEAVQDAMVHGGQGTIYFPGYVPTDEYYPFHAPVYAGRSFTFSGDGFNSAIVGVNSDLPGLFDIESGGDWSGSVRFEKLQIAFSSQQPSGGYGVRLGYNSESVEPIFDGVYFKQLYDGILCINCNTVHLDNSAFWNFGHTAITTANSITPDNGGPRISNTNFQNDGTISPVAEAAILITSTSEHMISNNTLDGGNTVKYFVEYNSATSGGWINIANNKCENTTLGCISLTGYGAATAITGNTMANSGNFSSWAGISVNGTSGAGFVHGTITGNAIQGASSSNSNYGIFFPGTTTNWSISGNMIEGINFGLVFYAGSTHITVSPHSIQPPIYSSAYFAANGSSVLFQQAGTTYYTEMTNNLLHAAAGSVMYCSDCNAACTAGSSTGNLCFKNGSVWTH